MEKSEDLSDCEPGTRVQVRIEKENELAKDGAVLDDGFMAEVRSKTVEQEREELYVALQYAASFHCLVEE